MKNAEREGAMNPISCRAQERHGGPCVLFSSGRIQYRQWRKEERERERKKEKCRFLRYNQLVRVVADIRAQRYPDNRSQMRVARCGNTPPPSAPPTLQPSTALSPSLRSTNKFVAPRYPDFNVFRYGSSPSTPPIIIWRRVQLRRRENSWREKIEQVVFDFFFLIFSQLIYHLDVMGREKKRLEDVKLYNFTIGKIIKKIFVRFVIIVHHQFCGSFRERKLTKG